MTENTEQQLIALIATDRLHIPISSLEGKFKRRKIKFASEIELPTGRFQGPRTYAYEQDEEGKKARGMAAGIKEFCDRHPNYGDELRGLIAEQRTTREPTLYFGMNEGCRLTGEDYLAVLGDIGFSEAQAQRFYEPLIEASRKISRARADGQRSILIG
jgi:hypothetical protein